MNESRWLRPMQDADLARVLTWRNADPVRRRMYTTHEITPAEHAAWWAREKNDPATRLMVFEADGEACAVVSFTRVSGADGSATLAFYGDPERRARHIGANLELAAFDYAFETLQLRRLEGEVLDFNAPVMNFHLRQGVKLEGTRRQAYVRDGVAHDIHCFGLLREEWIEWVGPALRARASGTAPAVDIVGRNLRAELTVPKGPLAEAAVLHDVARRLAEGLPLTVVALLAQAVQFDEAPRSPTLSLRARVATHVGSRLVWKIRLVEGERSIASGWITFRVASAGAPP